jgi:site-specific DNA-methyltransferase (cytosine-N4-specific)
LPCAANRWAGLPIHPARFPPGVPEFFIRFLTRPGQLVLDAFAGSNVTGGVAESLERAWISIEINADYMAGSKLRFPDAVPGSGRPDTAAG